PVQPRATGSSTAAATPFSSTHPVKKAPSWCATDGTSWKYTRTEACGVFGSGLTVYDNHGVVTGQIILNYISYSYTETTMFTWAHQIEFDASSITGTAIGYSIEGVASCTSACTVNTSDFAPQLMTVHGDQNGEGFFDTTVSALGSVGFSNTTWTWWFDRPDGSGHSSNGTAGMVQVRCDNAVPR